MNDLTKRDDAELDYAGGMKMSDIADKYGVSKSTVRNWKSRYWNDDKTSQASQKTKKRRKSVAKTSQQKSDETEDVNEYGLNPEQEYYCQLRAKRIPQYRAYQIAYNNYKASQANVATYASHLESNDKIKTRINKIVDDTTHVKKWSFADYADEVMQAYEITKASLFDEGVKKGNTDAYFNALDRVKEVFQLDRADKTAIDAKKAQIELLRIKVKQLDGADDKTMDKMDEILKTLADDVKK